jgi:hypothetical protein
MHNTGNLPTHGPLVFFLASRKPLHVFDDPERITPRPVLQSSDDRAAHRVEILAEPTGAETVVQLIPPVCDGVDERQCARQVPVIKSQ